ncbi:MAG: alkaline phosphatase family protein [Deltaproteobacteria bacterium]|nr:alkaline phosphatase family protein [Deltaproteobacteria bacterium]
MKLRHARALAGLALSLLLSTAALARPRLGVVVVFDQLRSVEVDRYAPLFGPGGFGGLDAARYDALYSFASTETSPGHATLLTGANPVVHGIVTNQWYGGGKRQYVVEDARYQVFGASAGVGRSPLQLVAPTLGDAMKAESGGRARVVTVSLKDRAAVLSGGRAADLAVWYDVEQGRYVTGKYWVEAVPPWLEQLGADLPKKGMAAGPWTPLPLPPALAWLAPPDDRPGEGSAKGLSVTFPHDHRALPPEQQRSLYRMQPGAMDDVFTLALAAVDQLALGADDEPDLLVVSISTTDYIGHNFGPDSLEQLDTVRRADLALRAFVRALDARVGRRALAMVVTADHGAPPLPAPLEGGKLPGGILPTSQVVEAAERAAAGAAAKGAAKKSRVLAFLPPQLFIDTADLSAIETTRTLAAVRTAVGALPGIARVYDMNDPADTDAWSPLMREAAFPGRHAAIFVRQQPRVVFLENDAKRGTDHGTPYVYDRRVPLLVLGAGVRAGRYADAVDPRDVAPTLAFLLGVPPPDLASGRPVSAVGD